MAEVCGRARSPPLPSPAHAPRTPARSLFSNKRVSLPVWNSGPDGDSVFNVPRNLPQQPSSRAPSAGGAGVATLSRHLCCLFCFVTQQPFPWVWGSHWRSERPCALIGVWRVCSWLRAVCVSMERRRSGPALWSGCRSSLVCGRAVSCDACSVNVRGSLGLSSHVPAGF